MLVGRDRQTRVVAEALRDRGRVLVLVGAAGIGKSRLLEEALTAGNSLALTGRCLPLSVNLPLLPVIDVVRELRTVDDGRAFDAALAQCPAFVRTELARLLPEMGLSMAGDAPRQAQFEAIRLLLAGAGSPPVAIDDLHWCDAVSLDMLEYLITKPMSPPVLLATRPATECSELVQGWLNRITRVPDATVLELGPLTSEQVAQMLRTLGWAGTPDDEQRIALRSGGVPFYVRQLATLGAAEALPGPLHMLLRARLDGLSIAALDVAFVLAAAGRPVTDAELHAACGDSTGPAVRELAARGLMETSPVAGRALRRRSLHALLAEEVCADHTADEMRAVHARIADAFAAQPEVDADDVAQQLAHAGANFREFEWRLRAGEQARRRAAPREAYGQLARAIAINPDADVHLHLAAYGLARHSGETQAAAELAELMLTRFESTETGLIRTRLWHAVGHHRVLRDASGLDALARAVAIGRSEQRTAEYGYALYDLERHLRARGRTAEALALCPELRDVADACADPDLGVLVDVEIACHALLGGDDRSAEEAIARAESVSVRAIGQALNAAAMVTYLLQTSGRLEETIRYGRQVIAERETAGLAEASVTGTIRATVATALLERGLVEEAEQALGPARPGRPAPDAAASAEMRTLLDVARGRVMTAMDYWAETPPLLPYPALLSEAAPVRLEVLIEAGRPVEAVDQGFAALDVTLVCDESRFAGPTIMLLRRALADLAQASTSTQTLSEVRARSAALDRAIARAPSHPFRAGSFPATAAATGLTDAAEWSRMHDRPDPYPWRSAGAAWRALGRPWRSAYCELRGAQAALANRGSRPVAVEMLRQAWTQADGHQPLRLAIGDLGHLARIDLGHAHAVPAPKTTMFTDREQAVLKLLADGRTNAEIGRALYISPKTVSVHVTNILRKLGVHSRVEAVSRAHQNGWLD